MTITSEQRLSPQSNMGPVTLRVGDLEEMSSYYSQALSLEAVEEKARGAEVHRVLGRGATPMVKLVHTPLLPHGDRRHAGLFHTAFLFDDQTSLAATVFRAGQDPRSRFVGSSDHLVSEAFYFTDPEGNGVELYTDRDRSTWVRERGQIMMDTTWLDPDQYLRSHLTQESLDAGPRQSGRVGHVHLQVGDIAQAAAFYVDALGFDATLQEYPGALFAAAGGYHHHVAMNVWNSAGAGPRAASLGLGDVAVTVPETQDLESLAARLKARRIAFVDDGRSIIASDPWNTQVTVSLPGTSTEALLTG